MFKKSEMEIHKNQKSTPTIADILLIIKKGMTLLLLSEYYGIRPEDIVGICGNKYPKISFTKKGFAKILNKDNYLVFTEKNEHGRLIRINDLNKLLQFLSSQKILTRFPHFLVLIDENQYSNLSEPVEDNNELINRCINMQMMWKDWGDAGLAHIISSFQSLQRVAAAKMKKPLFFDFEDTIENGLSIEYQGEFYADHLYGAKLLDIWHIYLMSEEKRSPKKFLGWVQSLSAQQLQEYGIKNINEIPHVNYMNNELQRAPWIIQCMPGNRIEGPNIPPPTEENSEIEIIYAIGRSKNKLDFFGGPKRRGVINHSSFFGGGHTEGAGRMILKCKVNTDDKLYWVLYKMDNNSGHIKPNDKMTLYTLKELERIGFDLDAISWSSKWGSVGQRGESATMALRRLQKDLVPIQILDTKVSISSKRVDKIARFAKNGAIKELSLYLMLRVYKITVQEAKSVALLIMKTLENHLLLFKNGAILQREKAQYARKLANQATGLLKNAAITSPEFEMALENSVSQYESNLLLPQNNVTKQENDNVNITFKNIAHSHNIDIDLSESRLKYYMRWP
jgi:hypothetical protein